MKALFPTMQAGGLRSQCRAAVCGSPAGVSNPQSGRRRPTCLSVSSFRAFRYVLFALAVGIAATMRGAATASADLAGVTYEQKIGAKLPVDVTVRDEAGATHRIGEYFRNRPVVLIFGYSRCPQLCSVVANGAVEALRPMVPVAGIDYDVLYVSIDPNDTTRDLAGLKQRDVRHYGRGEASGWHYVAGRVPDIRQLAEAAGFHFRYDEMMRQYAHPSGLLVVTPQAVVSRYFLGVDFAPKDLVAALRRAGEGKTGESVFELLLICARGNGVTGRYGVVVWRSLEIGVLLTVGALGWGIRSMLRQERRRRDDVPTEVAR